MTTRSGASTCTPSFPSCSGSDPSSPFPFCPSARGEHMSFRTLVVASLMLLLGSPALALDGQVGIHDPSTIVQCDGRFYTWGTGGRALVSADGWTWERGGTYGG